MAKIILENEHGRYEIEVKNDPVDLSDYYHDLILPVLSAAGTVRKEEEG